MNEIKLKSDFDQIIDYKKSDSDQLEALKEIYKNCGNKKQKELQNSLIKLIIVLIRH